jgi:hypothetical protein
MEDSRKLKDMCCNRIFICVTTGIYHVRWQNYKPPTCHLKRRPLYFFYCLNISQHEWGSLTIILAQFFLKRRIPTSTENYMDQPHSQSITTTFSAGQLWSLKPRNGEPVQLTNPSRRSIFLVNAFQQLKVETFTPPSGKGWKVLYRLDTNLPHIH